MSDQKKGFLQSWGPLEITLLAIILLLCCGAAGLAYVALGGGGIFGGGPGEVAQSATPTPLPPPDTGAGGSTAPEPGPDAGQSTAAISLNPAAAAPGSTVTVQGSGFPANSRVVIYLVPKDPPNFALNSAVAGSDGGFSVEIIVPSDPRWLDESPVPVLAEAVDTGHKAQAQLNIASPTEGETPITPVAIGIVIVGKVQTTPQPPPPPSVPQLAATANVNVRQGPGTNYPILGVLLSGQTAKITGRNAEATWWQIEWSGAANGRGWLSAQYATAENIGNVPVVNAPPPPPPPPPTPTPDPGIPITEWRGEYWNNKDLAGPPTLMRNDVAVNFDWGLGSPHPSIPVDFFSARWTRTLNFSAGTYRFYARVDDGVRLWVDGALLIDAWKIQSPTTYAADVWLNEGSHNIRMEYYEETLGAVAVLSWERKDYSGLWHAEYWNNPDLRGNPVLVRAEPAVNYNWGAGSPAPGLVAPDNFSARWQRWSYFDSGDYTFRVRSDDGVRVWLDNQIIIDHWVDGDNGGLENTVFVPGGNRNIRIEYFERTGNAFISFSWAHASRPPNPPLAVIKAPSEGVMGQSVRFDGSRSRNGDTRIVRYEWDFGDGKRAEGEKVNYTYNATGEYRVKLRVTDEIGQRDETKIKIRIKQNPDATTPPVAVINAPSTGQVGDIIRFDGSASTSVTPILRYDWDFGDGIRAGGAVQDHIYNKAGTYDVTLTVLAQNGLRNSQNVRIRVDDPISGVELPTAVINAPEAGQVGQPLTFDAGASDPGVGGTLTEYNWAFGDGAVANAAAVQHQYTQAGAFVVTLEVVNDKGLRDKASHTVTVVAQPPPQPQPSIIGPDSVTVGESVDFSASVISAGPIVRYSWDFGDGNSAGGEQVSHSYQQDGTFTMTLEVEDEAGQVGSTTQQILVRPLSPPPAPAISGPDQALVGDSVTFTAADTRDPATNPTPIQDIIWDLSDPGVQLQAADSGLQSSVTHAYSAPGIYTVRVKMVDSLGRSGDAETQIEVIEQPASAAPVAIISGPDSATEGDLVQFSAANSIEGSGQISGIVWDFGDGTVDTSNSIDAEHAYAAAGDYTVTLTLNADDGQSGSATKSINIVSGGPALPIVPPGQGNPPEAVFSAEPQQAAVGETVNFDGGFSIGDNPIVSWEWNFGDGTTGSGMAASHVYNTAGSYPVILTVTDDQGLGSTSAPLFVDVAGAAQPQPQPEPVATPTPEPPAPLPAETPTPEPQPLPDTPTPEPPTETPVPVPVDTPTPLPPPPTDTPVPPPADTPTPEPPPANPPAAGFSIDPPNPAVDAPVAFDGGYSQSNAPIVEYRWNFGDGNSNNGGMAVTHVFTATGQYTVTLAVVDANGLASDPAPQLVVVNPAPELQPNPVPQPAPADSAAPADGG